MSLSSCVSLADSPPYQRDVPAGAVYRHRLFRPLPLPVRSLPGESGGVTPQLTDPVLGHLLLLCPKESFQVLVGPFPGLDDIFRHSLNVSFPFFARL